MNEIWNLSDIELGEHCRVRGLSAEGAMRRRLLDIGLVEGACVRRIGESPGGGLRAYRVCGAVIAIRTGDARDVFVERGAAWA